jgi:hypothetical protein
MPPEAPRTAALTILTRYLVCVEVSFYSYLPIHVVELDGAAYLRSEESCSRVELELACL